MKYNYVELGKVIKKIIDYRGKTPKKLGGDWVDSGIRVISAKNVHAGKLDNLESIRYVNAQIYSKWMKDEIQKRMIYYWHQREHPWEKAFYGTVMKK